MVTQKFYNYQNNLVFLILLSSLVTLHAWVSSYFVGATKIWSADNRMPDAFSGKSIFYNKFQHSKDNSLKSLTTNYN